MVSSLPSLRVRLQVRNIRRRRRRRRAQQVVQNPLAALHHRRAVRVGRHRQDAALPQQAAAIRIGQRHLAELRAVDIRDAVVLRQALIEERVVRVQQIQHAAVFAQDVLEEQLGLLLEALAQAFVELGEDVRDRASAAPDCECRATARRNSTTSALRRADRPAAGVPAGRARPGPSACLFGQVQQLVVGNAAPQEEGEPRRQFQIADAVHAAGRAARGSCSMRNRKSGETSIARSAFSMPKSKSRSSRPLR